jgi:dTDP-4-amino-4,6-dideoxygalactose transaminase
VATMPEFNPRIPRIRADCRKRERFPCRVVGGAVSEDLFARGVCLPSGTAMTEADLDRVVRIVRETGARGRR